MSDLTLPIAGLTTMFGYFFNKDGKAPRTVQTLRNTVNKTDIPNGKNIYSSNMVNEANAEVLQRSTENYKKAQTPQETGVLPPLFNTYSSSMPVGQSAPRINQVTAIQQSQINDINKFVDPTQINIVQRSLQNRPMFETPAFPGAASAGTGIAPAGKGPVSLLTGQAIDPNHNNMVPFFGSNIKQNIESFANQPILDLHTGNTSTYRKKREVEKFFQEQPENIYGSPLFTTEVDTDRYVPSLYRQSEQSFDFQRVSAPKSGTIDNNIRPEFKTVNQLRTWDNLKQTYEGRTLAGKMGDVGGVKNDVNRHRPETFYKKTQDHLFKTTGLVIAAKKNEDFETNFRAPARNDYTTDYYGNVGKDVPATQRRTRLETDDCCEDSSLVQTPKRINFENDYTRNVSGNKSANDYGKDSLRVQETERTTTGQITHQLNVGSNRRGVKTRFTDSAKETIKETTLISDNSGNVSTRFNEGRRAVADAGMTDYDPKTTQKESAALNNYKGIMNKESGLGYIVNKHEARTTNKESISAQSEYTGNGERIIKTPIGKGAHGKVKTTCNMMLKEEEDARDRSLSNTYSQQIPNKQVIGVKTKMRADRKQLTGRLDEALVKTQLQNNPYSMYYK